MYISPTEQSTIYCSEFLTNYFPPSSSSALSPTKKRTHWFDHEFYNHYLDKSDFKISLQKLYFVKIKILP
jgi:hypothetical protein